MTLGGRLRPAADATPADWIGDELGEFGTVGGLIPSRFERCLVVWHDEDRSPGWASPPQLVDWLATRLRDRTTTPEGCSFAIWEGYGFAAATTAALDRMPSVVLPHRRYHLFAGAVTDATELQRPGSPLGFAPDLWWPDDRAWFVATDTDLSWTCLGASAEVCEAIAGDLPPRRWRVVERATPNGLAGR